MALFAETCALDSFFSMEEWPLQSASAELFTLDFNLLWFTATDRGVGRGAWKRVKKKNHENKDRKDQPLILSNENVISSTPCPPFLCYRMKNSFRFRRQKQIKTTTTRGTVPPCLLLQHWRKPNAQLWWSRPTVLNLWKRILNSLQITSCINNGVLLPSLVH